MKKTTLIGKIQLLFISFIIFTGITFAGNIDVNKDLTTKLKITENTYSAISLTNTLSDINFAKVKTNEGIFTMFNVGEYGYSMTVGDPKLPVLKRLIEVPLNATYNIEVITQNYREFNLADYGIENYIFPAQPSLSKSDDPENVEFIFNEASYQINNYTGQELVKVVELGTMRGVKMARIEISPILYNPVQNTIKVYDNIEVKINFVGANVSATIQKKQSLFSPYFESIYKQLANYKTINSKELITDEPVTYIIVSDPMFESALQPFIEWKVKKGFNVVEAYTDDPNVGNTTASIKSYLEDFYENPPTGYNPQSFILFVGDNAQIPSTNSGGHLADLYFCTYDGPGDIYPECYYGRFSANSVTELQPQIDKTLEYEQYLFPDASFLDEVVMVAGNDAGHIMWSNGQINYGTSNYFNLAHGLTSHTYLQPEPGGGNYSQNIRQNVSDGVSFGNYTAHCGPSGWSNPSFENNHVAALQNAHKYPLLVGNCCSSNDFSYTCFGETLLRAVDKGAIGYIGGSASTYWDEDYWWGVGATPVSENPVYVDGEIGAYDGAFHDHGEPLDDWYVTQGQMTQAGDLAVTQAGGNETYYWEIYHLMGDPSLMIYYSQAPDPTANYQNLMPLGSGSFTVNTDPYSYVAISKDGVLHGCAIADNTGLAEVTMFDPIAIPGEADLIITAQNIKPYIGTVTVASPNTAYVLLDEIEIDDSNGNNNGLVDFSENILLDVTLENVGSLDATNLSATISSDDEFITIDNATSSWPNIAAGATSSVNGAFEFTVDDIVPDQHIAQFDIEVTDGTDTWISTFNITLNSPVLTIGSFTIDDAMGNNNGRLDPGETANIIIYNGNEGGCDAVNSIATAIASSALITINTATYDLGTISSGGSADAVINITIDVAAQVGDAVSMDYSVESSPYEANTSIAMNVGLIVEDFETGGFNSYDWEFSGNVDWDVDEADPYEGVYCAKSGDINDNQTSVLFITVDVTTDDQISFFYKVSSESGWDYLKFYIDAGLQGEWSGEVAWTEASYPVSAGEHTFKWEYFKDGSVSNGGDCAWIDYIVFPPFAAGPTPLAVSASASPSDICIGGSSQLNAFAMGGTGTYSYEWTPVTGLDDPNISNPIATPDASITYEVSVDDGENTVTDDVTVTVNPVPETPTITQQVNILVSSAASGNQWYNSNGIITGATGQSYEPTATDDYYVIVTNEFGCESDASDTYHFVYTGVFEIAGEYNVSIYPNPFKDQFTLDYSISSYSKVKISIFNTFGQLITIIEDENSKTAGNYKVNFDASNFKTGVYYCKIETADYSVVKRIIHSK